MEHFSTLINDVIPSSKVITLKYINDYESRGELKQLFEDGVLKS